VPLNVVLLTGNCRFAASPELFEDSFPQVSLPCLSSEASAKEGAKEFTLNQSEGNHKTTLTLYLRHAVRPRQCRESSFENLIFNLYFCFLHLDF